VLVMSGQVQLNSDLDRPYRQQNVVIELLLNLHTNGLETPFLIL
jgi:hypothetical protein